MQFRRFEFPGDLWLFPYIALKISYYFRVIAKKSPEELLIFIKNKAARSSIVGTAAPLVRMDKICRIIDYFLIRKLRFSRPCLVRSCILFEQALRLGLAARLHIGVRPEAGALLGHSWITVNNVPYKENAVMVSQYTTMIEG